MICERRVLSKDRCIGYISGGLRIWSKAIITFKWNLFSSISVSLCVQFNRLKRFCGFDKCCNGHVECDDVDEESPIEIKERFMSSIKISRVCWNGYGSATFGGTCFVSTSANANAREKERKRELTVWSIAIRLRIVNIGRTTVLTIFIIVIKKEHRNIQVFIGLCWSQTKKKWK